MSLETILIWCVIGLIAGWLASMVVGGGFGLVGDIIVGIVGAFIGGAIFRALGEGQPGGFAGTVIVAFIGACVLLLLLRAISRGRARVRA